RLSLACGGRQAGRRARTAGRLLSASFGEHRRSCVYAHDRRVFATLILAVPAQAAWQPEPATYGIAEQHNVPVTMSDGTVLRADSHNPDNADRLHAKR